MNNIININDNLNSIYDISEAVKNKIKNIEEYNIGITFYPGSNINRLHLLLNSLIYKPIKEIYLNNSSVMSDSSSRNIEYSMNNNLINYKVYYVLCDYFKLKDKLNDKLNGKLDSKLNDNIMMDIIKNLFNEYNINVSDDLRNEICNEIFKNFKENSLLSIQYINNIFKNTFELYAKIHEKHLYIKLFNIINSDKIYEVNEELIENEIDKFKILINNSAKKILNIINEINTIKKDKDSYKKNIHYYSYIMYFNEFLYAIYYQMTSLSNNINQFIDKMNTLYNEYNLSFNCLYETIVNYVLNNVIDSYYDYKKDYNKEIFEFINTTINNNKSKIEYLNENSETENEIINKLIQYLLEFKNEFSYIYNYHKKYNDLYSCKSIKNMIEDLLIVHINVNDSRIDKIDKILYYMYNINGDNDNKYEYIYGRKIKKYDKNKYEFKNMDLYRIWKFLQDDKNKIDDLFISNRNIMNAYLYSKKIIHELKSIPEFDVNKYTSILFNNNKELENLYKYCMYYSNDDKLYNYDDDIYYGYESIMENKLTKDEKRFMNTIFEVTKHSVTCDIKFNKLRYYTNYDNLIKIIEKYNIKDNQKKEFVRIYDEIKSDIENIADIYSYYHSDIKFTIDNKHIETPSKIIFDIKKVCPFDNTLITLLSSIPVKMYEHLCININDYECDENNRINRADFVILNNVPLFRKNIIGVKECEHIKDIKLHFIEDGIENPNYKEKQEKIKEEIQKFYNKYKTKFKNIYTYGSKYHTSVMTSRMLFYKKTQYEYSIVCDDDDIAVNGIDTYYDLFEKVRKKFVIDDFLAFSHPGCIVNKFNGNPSLFGMWAMVMFPNSHNIQQSINNMCGEDARCVYLSHMLPYYDYNKTFYMYLWASNQGYSKNLFNELDYKDYLNLYKSNIVYKCTNYMNRFNGPIEKFSADMKKKSKKHLDYRYDEIVKIKSILENVKIPCNIYDSNEKYTFMSTRPIVPTFNL